MQTGLKPVLRALGLEVGGMLVLRRPAQAPPAGAKPQVEVAVGTTTPEVQGMRDQRRQADEKQVLLLERLLQAAGAGLEAWAMLAQLGCG